MEQSTQTSQQFNTGSKEKYSFCQGNLKIQNTSTKNFILTSILNIFFPDNVAY